MSPHPIPDLLDEIDSAMEFLTHARQRAALGLLKGAVGCLSLADDAVSSALCLAQCANLEANHAAAQTPPPVDNPPPIGG